MPTEEAIRQEEPSFMKDQESAEPAKNRRPLVMAIVAAVVVAAGLKGYGAYSYSQTHVETDNAYVTGDLVNISPMVSGTLSELKVEDGDFVHKGQLIAKLDTEGPAADLAQAEANLRAAESEVPSAHAELAFTKLSTDASIQSSQAAIATQSARTAASRMQVRLSNDTVQSQVKQAQSQVSQAKAQESEAQVGIRTAISGLAEVKQAVETARRTADAAHAAVTAAKADADHQSQDLERYQKLFADEAVSRQQYDAAVAAAGTAAANLEAARQRAAAADSQVDQAKATVEQAQDQVAAARSQAETASKQVQVAQAGVSLATAGRTQVRIQDANVQTNEGQTGEANAGLQSAQAGLQQVSLRQRQIVTAEAQLQQAKAAVDHAKVLVNDAYLYAPTDGYVVKHSANVGTAINPGQTVATITRGNDVWVMANFKETQLENVRDGQPAEFEVDAFPGRKFRGKVLSIIHATGSATTLLPPDNSTGNFTKIVQRVPVKISLVSHNPQDAALLRQGMSVLATIDTAKE